MERVRPVASRFAALLSKRLDEVDPARAHEYRNMSADKVRKFLDAQMEQVEKLSRKAGDRNDAIKMCVDTAAIMMIMADTVTFCSDDEVKALINEASPV